MGGAAATRGITPTSQTQQRDLNGSGVVHAIVVLQIEREGGSTGGSYRHIIHTSLSSYRAPPRHIVVVGNRTQVGGG